MFDGSGKRPLAEQIRRLVGSMDAEEFPMASAGTSGCESDDAAKFGFGPL